MDSIQDGGHQHMNSAVNVYHQHDMDGSYMNQDINSYGSNPGEPDIGIDSYSRMNERVHSGHILQYNSFDRSALYPMPMKKNMIGSDYDRENSGYGQCQMPNSRENFQALSRQSIIRTVRTALSSDMEGEMVSGPGGYVASQQRMMSGQSISQQSGPTPTLNQLLQTSNSQARFPNNHDGYGSTQKGAEVGPTNESYGTSLGWSMQSRRGMDIYPPVPMTGPAAHRAQSQPNYIQQGYSQQPTAQLQYNSQSSQPLGQPLGSSPQQQRPTPQPSPLQLISPAASPPPAHRAVPNDPLSGPFRPKPQLSPRQQHSSQLSPTSSHRASSSQSLPGHLNLLPNMQQNHLSSPKDSPFVGEDVEGESTLIGNSSQPKPSPGSVGSRSNTPASLSGASPMPPWPPSQQDGSLGGSYMSHSPMPAPGYNQQMMPPPTGLGAQLGYSQVGKMGPGAYSSPYQNTPYTQTGNYGLRQSGPGIENYPQNMYNGPTQMSPGGQPIYNNMGDPSMTRSSYSNTMYCGQGNMIMGINNQYVTYNGPGQSSQHGPGTNMSSPGPSVNGPHGTINSNGSNGLMTGLTPAHNQGQSSVKGAQAAAQAAIANAGSQTTQGMPNPNAMRSESLSPLSHMGHMNQMGNVSSIINDMLPHPQNSLPPGPNTMVHKPTMTAGTTLKNSVKYNREQTKKSSKSKSKSAKNSSVPPTDKSVTLSESMPRNSVPSQRVGMPGQFSDESSMPQTTSTLPPIFNTCSNSNDSSSMGPLLLSPLNSAPPSGHMYKNSAHRDMPECPPSASNVDSGHSYKESEHNRKQTVTTAHNSNTDTLISRSISSPVTILSTQDGNSNDSQPIPVESMAALKKYNSTQSLGNVGEPPAKKKKTDVSQAPFARVVPSPGGVSVASSGTHEDIDNIGSPSGFASVSKSGGGDYLKLYEMGMEPKRRPFLDRLFALLEDKGTPISNMPVISKQPIDLYRLYVIVQEKGGMVEVTKAKKWKEVCGLINVSGSASAACTLKKNYIKFLFAHECCFEHGGMDPTPVLAQMEKKRAAKQRNRAPSPAGSQGSQDGMLNQYMQNDPAMSHMSQGMMGNHMMSNMGLHGGPVVGQNMRRPHHMGPGMQGQGHMMGSFGHQNYPGNADYMVQGGPGNMVSKSGMIGPVMQVPTGMMGTMGPGPQQSNMVAQNSINPQPNMMNNMNMMSHNNMISSGNSGHPGGMMPSANMGHPPGGMMPLANMGYPPGGMMPSSNTGHPSGGMMPSPNTGHPLGGMMPSPNTGHPPGGMMPLTNTGYLPGGVMSSASTGHSQSNMMHHNNMNPQPMLRPTLSDPSDSGPMMAPNSMMRGNSDSVSCKDPFADEPYQNGHAGQGLVRQCFPGTQQNIGVPHCSSPIPLSSGGMIPSNGPMSSGSVPPNDNSLSVPPNSLDMSPHIPLSQLNTDMPSNSSRMTPQTMSEMQSLSTMMQQNSGIPPHSLSTENSKVMSLQFSTNSSHSASQPNLFSQDSNSNSSLSETASIREPLQYDSNQMTSMGSQSLPQGMMPPDVLMNNSSSFSYSASAPGRQFPFGENQFTKPERFEQKSQNMPQPSNPQMSQAPMINQAPQGLYPQQQTVVNQTPYMNHHQQQPPMGQAYGHRYGNPMPTVPADQYNQGYSGATSQQAGFAPRLPQSPQSDQYQSYPEQGQYGKPMTNRSMLSNLYTAPNKRFSDNEPDAYMSPDQSNQNQWYPMPPQRSYHTMSQYGPTQVPRMSPNGPQSMPQMRMSPNKNRDYSMSTYNKQRSHACSMPGVSKKEMIFPLGTVESTQPLMNKWKKLTRHDVGQIEAWRLMMSLKSGLLAESTWALDTLNVLLSDDSTVAYFGLAHLPGLLEALLDHFRRCLIEMFDLFEDSQIGCGHDDFKENLIRMAILESAKESRDSLLINKMKEMHRANKAIIKIEHAKDREVSCDIKNLVSNDKKLNDNDEKVSSYNIQSSNDLKSRPNYTFITKQEKDVHVEENSDLNGLLDDKFWDVYGDFSDQIDLWECGKGDLTEHIFTHMEDTNESKRTSWKFFRNTMKLKDVAIEMKSDYARENFGNLGINFSEKVKIKMEYGDSETNNSSSFNNKDSDSETHSNSDHIFESEKCETSSENTDSGSDKSGSEKNHTCNRFLKDIVAIKSEQRDLVYDKPDSSDSMNIDENMETQLFLQYEPRMKFPVKYELLNHDELVQICKTQFGWNSEGERNYVEDESYQRNEPPLCLTTEAQNEISRRCICLSNIFRSLSCIPGNDLDMSCHSGLMYILGRLLLLHHEHLPRSRAERVPRKFDLDDIDQDLVDTTPGVTEWWWDCLNILRENTLVIFANNCAQLRLDVFPDEICSPILDGLLHWVVCPSSCASDPLPTVGTTSVLSPLRLVLEALCKLCIHDKNVDMLLACPPYERIVQLFGVLTKLLANINEQVTVEFAIVLLSQLVQGGSSAARGIALQHPSISLLIDFLETAEQNAMQYANRHDVEMLRNSPNVITSLDMLRRAATVLLYLSKVPENHKLFVHHQNRLLSLVMSQILDHSVTSLLSDVLFQFSQVS